MTPVDRGARTQAAGDVQNGPIEIREVRIRRGTPGSQIDVHANALAGMVVSAPAVGQEIEMWVTWSASPLPATSPRLVIDFGDGWVDNISCGSCLQRHTYNREGRYTVKVLMDDRVGGTTTRTFTLDVVGDGPPCGAGVSSNFDAFSFGAPGSALGIPGVSIPGTSGVVPAFSPNTSGGALLALVGAGDINLVFDEDQSSVDFEYAYQAGFPATISLFGSAGQLLATIPALGAFDSVSFSIYDHAALSHPAGIRSVVFGNGSNGVMIDNLQTTPACR